MGRRIYWGSVSRIIFFWPLSWSIVWIHPPSRTMALEMPSQTQPHRSAPSMSASVLYEEGLTLFRKGTQTSFQQAIAKFKLALESTDHQNDRLLQAKIYQTLGFAYDLDEQYPQSLDAHQQALTLYQQLNHQPLITQQMVRTSSAYARLGDYSNALQLLQTALEEFERQPAVQGAESTSHFELKAIAYSNLGSIYSSLGQFSKSIEAYQWALNLHENQGDISNEIDLWTKIAYSYSRNGEMSKSSEALQQALILAEQGNLAETEAEILEGMAKLADAAGENKQALKFRNKIRKLKLTASNLGFEGIPIQDEALSQSSLMLAKAFENLDRIRALEANPLGDLSLHRKPTQIFQLAQKTQIFTAFMPRDRAEETLAPLNESLDRLQRSGDRQGLATALGRKGNLYLKLGEPQQALDAYHQALTIRQTLGDPLGEITGLRALGSFYQTLGDYDTSIYYYQEAFKIAQPLEKKDLQGTILNQLGQVYQFSLDHRAAIASYRQALAIWTTEENAFQQVATALSLSRLLTKSQSDTDARQTAQSAIRLAEQSGNRDQQGEAYALLGHVELSANRPAQAIRVFQLSQKLRKGNPFHYAASLNDLGSAYQQNQQPTQAITIHQQALTLYTRLDAPIETMETLYLIAKAERENANLIAAQTQIEKALEQVEQYRSKLMSPDLRSRYFASVQKYYEFYIDLLMQRHQQYPEQGFNIQALLGNERAKARSLQDLLVEANADIEKDIDPEMWGSLKSLQQQITETDSQWRTMVGQPDQQDQTTVLKANLKQLLVQERYLQTQLRQMSPRYATLSQPPPLSLATIQQQVLDSDTMLLEYSLGQERSYLWSVTQTGIQSYMLPNRDAIEAAAQTFYRSVTNRTVAQSNFPSGVDGTGLREMILPATLQLSKKRILIVGDGILNSIPFAALPSPSRSVSSPLILDHEVVMLPSSSTLVTLRDQLRDRPLAANPIAIAADPVFSPQDPRVIANTSVPQRSLATTRNLEQRYLERATQSISFELARLPGTRTEAEQILKLSQHAKNLQILDFDASIDSILSPELGEYQMIHLATHSIANADAPELSGLILSQVDRQGKPQNGFLRLGDLFNLNWPAELVVLSACETGLGEAVRGEGIVGLARGLMYAGSKRVLVSLWSVDDRGTQELMTRFYQKLLKKNLSPAAALRAAQLELWNDPQWRSPYYWAAFTLQGEW